MDYLSLLGLLSIVLRYTSVDKGSTINLYPLAYGSVILAAAILVPLWLRHHERRGSKLGWTPSPTASQGARAIRYAAVSAIGAFFFWYFLDISVPYLPGKVIRTTATVSQTVVSTRGSSCDRRVALVTKNGGESYVCLSYVQVSNSLPGDWLREGARLSISTHVTIVGTSLISIDALEDQ